MFLLPVLGLLFASWYAFSYRFAHVYLLFEGMVPTFPSAFFPRRFFPAPPAGPYGISMLARLCIPPMLFRPLFFEIDRTRIRLVAFTNFSRCLEHLFAFTFFPSFPPLLPQSKDAHRSFAPYAYLVFFPNRRRTLSCEPFFGSFFFGVAGYIPSLEKSSPCYPSPDF